MQFRSDPIELFFGNHEQNGYQTQLRYEKFVHGLRNSTDYDIHQ